MVNLNDGVRGNDNMTLHFEEHLTCVSSASKEERKASRFHGYGDRRPHSISTSPVIEAMALPPLES